LSWSTLPPEIRANRVKVRCYLREIRGRRPLRDLAEASGVNRGTLSTIELGRRLPKDEEIEPLEQAYGQPFEHWYPAAVTRALELDEERVE
jgi:transcriptional regulator with XRE-family HTH domain